MEIRLFTEKEQSTEDTCEGCYFYDGCCENTMFSKVCTTEKIIWKLSFNETTELINKLDLTPILNDKVRQVRWLYANSNKCTMVYDEKLVRLIVQRLQERINELESSVGNQQSSTESKCNKHFVSNNEVAVCYSCDRPTVWKKKPAYCKYCGTRLIK